MIKSKTLISSTLVSAAMVFLSGCAGSYEPVPNLAKLDAKFVDKKWDGKKILENEVCGLYGGEGNTPKIMVSNIPQGANAIIMEVNDLGYQPLSNNGGHGKIGFWINKGSSSTTLESIPEDKAKKDDEKSKLLGETRIEFGRY